MKCALWLNKQRIHHASEIPENLDVASLRGYFLAGSLVDWLRENGGSGYAVELSRVSADDPRLNEKIAEIFRGEPLISKSFGDKRESTNGIAAGLSNLSWLSKYGSYKMFGSFGSFEEFWKRIGSGAVGSFGYFGGSGGSAYLMWEWSLSLRRRYGSFNLAVSSGLSGSFGWNWLFGSGSFVYDNFPFDLINGKFGSLIDFPFLDEFDRILFETLRICPLDRYGYGIHNI